MKFLANSFIFPLCRLFVAVLSVIFFIFSSVDKCTTPSNWFSPNCLILVGRSSVSGLLQDTVYFVILPCFLSLYLYFCFQVYMIFRPDVGGGRHPKLNKIEDQARVADLNLRLLTGNLLEHPYQQPSTKCSGNLHEPAHQQHTPQRHQQLQQLPGNQESRSQSLSVLMDRAVCVNQRSIADHQREANEIILRIQRSMDVADAMQLVSHCRMRQQDLHSFLRECARRKGLHSRARSFEYTSSYKSAPLFIKDVQEIRFEGDFAEGDGDLALEMELQAVGASLGILTDEGKFSPKCDCEQKFEQMKRTIAEEQQQIVKAKYFAAFLRRIDEMVIFVVERLKALEERETSLAMKLLQAEQDRDELREEVTKLRQATKDHSQRRTKPNGQAEEIGIFHRKSEKQVGNNTSMWPIQDCSARPVD